MRETGGEEMRHSYPIILVVPVKGHLNETTSSQAQAPINTAGDSKSKKAASSTCN